MITFQMPVVRTMGVDEKRSTETKLGAVAAAVASSEDLRDQSASPKIMGLETDLDTSSEWTSGTSISLELVGNAPDPLYQNLHAGRSAHLLQAVPAAHLTIIDCAGGKPLLLAAPPAPPHALSPNLGPITPPMKTYILFCGRSQSRLIQEAPLGGGALAQTRGTLPPCRGTVTSAFSSVSPLRSQEPPEAMGSPSKTVPTRSSAWETVTDTLKAFSSCVCGQADELKEPDLAIWYKAGFRKAGAQCS
ncbi:LOW QUALITY PROTEIN: steroid receptor-associated and regulated protein [Glossophaga mutica]